MPMEDSSLSCQLTAEFCFAVALHVFNGYTVVAEPFTAPFGDYKPQCRQSFGVHSITRSKTILRLQQQHPLTYIRRPVLEKENNQQQLTFVTVCPWKQKQLVSVK